MYAPVKYQIDPGREVHVACQEWSEEVTARDDKPSSLWDRVGPDQWIPDAMVDTNADTPVAPFCDHSS